MTPPAHDPALLAAIKANPDDDLPRLVYADWLEEHGDPPRAQMVRDQVALARREWTDTQHRADMHSRVALWMKGHGPDWAGALGLWGGNVAIFDAGHTWTAAYGNDTRQLYSVTFVRGFPHRVTGPLDLFWRSWATDRTLPVGPLYGPAPVLVNLVRYEPVTDAALDPEISRFSVLNGRGFPPRYPMAEPLDSPMRQVFLRDHRGRAAALGAFARAAYAEALKATNNEKGDDGV